jgi:hypothetical protein
VPAAPAGLTRESLAVHSMNPACVPCHQLIDPPGLSFENYDGLGRHRTASAGGQLIDATGAIRLTDLESKVKNAVELAQAVAKSRDASACLAQHWLRYFLRRPEDPREMGAVTLLAEAAERSNDLREMLLSLTRLPSFQLRLAGEGEMP